jgi:hypothetical protein
MPKKDVLSAGRVPSNGMEGLHYTNSDFNVCDVIEHLSGKQGTTVSHGVSTGSGCGLPRIAPLDYYAGCPATVPPNLNESRITGLNKTLRRILITLRSGT